MVERDRSPTEYYAGKHLARVGRWTYLGLVLLCFGGASSARAIECAGPLSADGLKAAITSTHPAWFQNIPVELRVNPRDTSAEARLCDFYRAANGMDGALCIDIAPVAPASEPVAAPAGSFGDNQVDRVVELSLAAADGTIECGRAQELLAAAVEQNFVPVETDSAAGQVCVRDVMRPPSFVVASADVLSPTGEALPDIALLPDGQGCFAIDDNLPAGNYAVSRFNVDTFAGEIRDLGITAALVVEGAATTVRAWFVDDNPNGENLGSFVSPFQSVSGLNAAQGTADGPATGDLIFVAGGQLDEPVQLLDRQWLIGNGTDWLARLAEAGVTVPVGLDATTAPAGDAPTVLVAFGAAPFSPAGQRPLLLAQDNQVYGVHIVCPNCSGLTAESAGSLKTRDLSLAGAGIARLIDTHLDVEIEHFQSTSDNRRAVGRGSIFLSGTTGRFAVLGSSAELSTTIGGLGITLLQAENVSFNRISTHYLRAEEVTNLAVTESEVRFEEPRFSGSFASGISLFNVWGNASFTDVEIGERQGNSDFSKTNFGIFNTTGNASVLLEDVLIVGRMGSFPRPTQRAFDQLLRASVVGDAGMELVVRNAVLQDSQLGGVDISIADTARLDVAFTDVSVRNFSRRFVDPALSLRSSGGYSAIDEDFELSFTMLDSNPIKGSSESFNSGIRNPGAIGMLFDFQFGAGQVDIDIRDTSVRAFPFEGAFLPGHQPILVRSNASTNVRMNLADGEFWSAIDGAAITTETAGSLDLTLTGNRTFGDFSGLALRMFLDGVPGMPATACLDASNNTFIVWGPEEGNVARFSGGSADTLRLPDYVGSPTNASADILDWLVAKNNELRTFNDQLEFSVAAQTLGDVLPVAGCALPVR